MNTKIQRDCPDEDLICMYLDGFFEGKEKEWLELHITTCKLCKSRVNHINKEHYLFIERIKLLSIAKSLELSWSNWKQEKFLVFGCSGGDFGLSDESQFNQEIHGENSDGSIYWKITNESFLVAAREYGLRGLKIRLIAGTVTKNLRLNTINVISESCLFTISDLKEQQLSILYKELDCKIIDNLRDYFEYNNINLSRSTVVQTYGHNNKWFINDLGNNNIYSIKKMDNVFHVSDEEGEVFAKVHFTQEEQKRLPQNIDEWQLKLREDSEDEKSLPKVTTDSEETTACPPETSDSLKIEIDSLVDEGSQFQTQLVGEIISPFDKNLGSSSKDEPVHHIDNIIGIIKTAWSNFVKNNRSIHALTREEWKTPDGRFSWKLSYDEDSIVEISFTTAYIDELKNKKIGLEIENKYICEPVDFINTSKFLFNYSYSHEKELNNLIENHVMSNELKECFKKYQHEIGEFTITTLEKNRWILKTPKGNYILFHGNSPVKETNVLMVGVNKLEAKVYVKLHKIGEYFDKLELVFV